MTTDILTRMRSMTRETLAGVRTDFDDAPVPVYVSRAPKNMVRIVEGADDLAYTGPANLNPGTVKPQDWSDRPELPTITPTGPVDARSERQVDLMESLINQIAELDAELGAATRTWTNNATAAGNYWTPGREGTASAWIGRMIAKVRELKAAAPKVTPSSDDQEFQAIPNGYYAVGDAGPDDIHYFRISRFRDGGIKVQEQASDTLHPVRRGSRRTAILRTILNVGPAEASSLYGRTIGRCGRCNRTLTDATSRARGIGPDCLDKM